MHRAVFLDKDGTLVENVPFNAEPEAIRLAPGARTALAELAAQGYRLFVVSNQPGVALGYFDQAALETVAAHLQALLAEAGVELTAFYWCPHHPAAACACRKPRPGLLLQAAREHGIVLRDSWMVGDILDDVEAGRRAGCRTVLIDNGNETEWRAGALRRPEFVARGLQEAAERIVHARAGNRTAG